MAEEQKKEQQTGQEKETRQFEQVIPVDSSKLRLIKINNISGKTFISGGPAGRITIRTLNSGTYNYTPAVEFKQEGSTIEISAVPYTGGDWMVKILRGFQGVEDGGKWVYDSEAGNKWTYHESDWTADETEWPDPDAEGLSHEMRQHLRAERLRMREEARERQHEMRDREREMRDREREMRDREREERQRAREDRQRIRYEVRESQRQAHEAARQGRNFWTDLEQGLEPLGEILNSVGRSISQAFTNPDVLYIEIPANVELEAKSVSGGLEVSNMTSYCLIKNTSGSVTLRRLSGGVRVKGISGKVEGQEIGGKAEIKVTSGSVDLTNCRFTGLDLSVSSGRIMVETELAGPPDGDYKLNTASGAVKLLLPRDSRASVDCRTLNGRLVMPKISAVEIRNRPGQSQARIDLNGGGRKVSVNTLNGNVELALYDQPGENTGWNNVPADQSQPNWPNPIVPPMPPIPPMPPVGFVPPVPPTPPAPPAWPAGIGPNPTWGSQVKPPTPNYGWQTPSESRPPADRGPIVPPAPQNSAGNPGQPESAAPVSEPATTSQPAAAPENDKRSRQLDILQAIERGEISVDEGMRRLGEVE